VTGRGRVGRGRKWILLLIGAALVVAVVGAFTSVQAKLRSDPIANRAKEIRRLAASELPRIQTQAARIRSEARHAGLSRAGQLRWFRSGPVGVFVHYGPTSTFAASSEQEWFENLTELVSTEADTRISSFTPDPMSTKTWIAAAKAAGASYLTVIAKHHDGLCLFASDVTSWDVDEEHDLLKVLVSEARHAGLRVFIYYSLLDFHELTYGRNRSAYSEFVTTQIRELLTGYGPIAGMWFDLPRYADGLSKSQLAKLYRLIHRLQPWALIGANHHGEVLPGEDFEILERAFPNNPRRIPALRPQQAAFKLGRTWFWSGVAEPRDARRFERLKAEAQERRVSLLANIAARPDGTVPETVIRGLAAQSS
jgi:alpha-L-fucosidase